jgi:hypothetical protein
LKGRQWFFCLFPAIAQHLRSAAVNSSSQDHVTLAKPSGSRLLHAGEHTHELYRATVHGAFLSGEREAMRIIAARLLISRFT